MSPLICGRLSPAAHEIRICGSANNKARNRSASICRPWMSERSRASLEAERTRARIKRIAAITEKPSNANAVASTAISWRLNPKKVEIECSTLDRSPASAGAIAAAMPKAIRPLRANDVHDSKVRRIDAITPDMVCPKPHDFAPGARLTQSRYLFLAVRAPVRESNDNILNGSRPVRVQIVNAKPHREKMRY